LVADATGTTVWKWDQQEPFGNDTPNGDPNNTGNVFDYPGRLSGYYADKETGNFYAMQRDAYNPSIGAFPQSDPVGLRGGINTYAYVNGNPLGYSDPTGKFVFLLPAFPAVADLIIAGVGLISGAIIANSIKDAIESPSQSSSSTISKCPPDDDACDQLHRIDTDTCNAITRKRGAAAGAICHASAGQRLGECRRFGISGVRTPLATWNN
jgi:RHS repeat-associated protein